MGELLTNRPGRVLRGPSGDELSQQLRTVALSGGVFFHARLAAPFGLEWPSCRQAAEMLSLGSRRVVSIHVVIAGAAEVRVTGREPLPLGTGDGVVFLHDGSHVLASPGAHGWRPIAPLLPPPPYDGVQPLRCGGHGAVTEMLCGFLHAERTIANPLLDLLPEVVAVRRRDDSAASARSGILRLLENEAARPRPGGTALLVRLAELLLVHVLREYLASRPDGSSGWRPALDDPVIARMLGLLHAEPERPWSLQTLARTTGLSRSAVSRRFTGALGLPPMRYLARLRIQQATRLLRDTDLTVSAVAHRVGYESEETFNRAFRRTLGRPPGAWRKHPCPVPPLSSP